MTASNRVSLGKGLGAARFYLCALLRTASSSQFVTAFYLKLLLFNTYTQKKLLRHFLDSEEASQSLPKSNLIWKINKYRCIYLKGKAAERVGKAEMDEVSSTGWFIPQVAAIARPNHLSHWWQGSRSQASIHCCPWSLTERQRSRTHTTGDAMAKSSCPKPSPYSLSFSQLNYIS